MNNFYDADPTYTIAKTQQLQSIRPDYGEVQNIRQRFKQLTGRALYAFFAKHTITEIGDPRNIVCWCQIAADSHAFADAVNMIECIMMEMTPENGLRIDLDLRRKTAESKSELNTIFALARNEAKIIRQLYNRVGQYDHAYDGKREYAKIRKALVFLKRAIFACVYSKLPTSLSSDEYTELVRLSTNPEIGPERYRYNETTRAYIRIGGLSRKRAYRLFGFVGCAIFVQKAIHRYEVMLEALHH